MIDLKPVEQGHRLQIQGLRSIRLDRVVVLMKKKANSVAGIMIVSYSLIFLRFVNYCYLNISHNVKVLNGLLFAWSLNLEFYIVIMTFCCN